jgi:hypothetical protein
VKHYAECAEPNTQPSESLSTRETSGKEIAEGDDLAVKEGLDKETKIKKFQQKVLAALPHFSDLISLEEEILPLPSKLGPQNKFPRDYSRYANYELRARVGYAHDLLADLRVQIYDGTSEFRKSKKNIRTSTDAVNAAPKRERINSAIANFTRLYQKNWCSVMNLCDYLKLGEDTAEVSLAGLKALTKDDTKFLTAWLNSDGDYREDSSEELPWIWDVRKITPGLSIMEQIGRWEDEGMSR